MEEPVSTPLAKVWEEKREGKVGVYLKHTEGQV